MLSSQDGPLVFRVNDIVNYKSKKTTGNFIFRSSESDLNFKIHETLNGPTITNTQNA